MIEEKARKIITLEELKKRGGILRDGETLRIPAPFADSKRRGVSRSAEEWAAEFAFEKEAIEKAKAERDGQKLKTGQRDYDVVVATAGSRPGFCFVGSTDPSEKARQEYIARLQDAWKQPNLTSSQPQQAETRTEDARQDYLTWLENAWRTPS